MAEDLFIPVKKVVEVQETAGVTLRELSLAAGTPTKPAAMNVVLGALDDEGEWRQDVTVPAIQFIDKMDSENPMERYEASALLNMMFTAIVADTPQHQAMGIANETVWEAAKILAPAKLAALFNPQEPGE